MVQEPGEDSNLVRHSIYEQVFATCSQAAAREESLVASTAAIH
jgi:hypothetical protein